jgi:arylsulfatase
MSDDDKQDRKLDRRSLLIGAAAGVAGTAAVAVGVDELKKFQRSVATPKALPNGATPQIELSFADSRPTFDKETKAPAGAPNIISIILDDVGFSDLGCYGSEIPTPNFDALAAGGLRYTNFRTTAMCSPTRAVFHTGLNHHSAGMGWLADIDSGYPGYRGDMTHEAATIAETLRDAGWSTFLLGKWHINNVESTGATGPYHNWPTSRGYERAYWYQGHSTDYFKPGELFDGVTRSSRPTCQTITCSTTSPIARSPTSTPSMRWRRKSRSSSTSPFPARIRRCRSAAATAIATRESTTAAGTRSALGG